MLPFCHCLAADLLSLYGSKISVEPIQGIFHDIQTRAGEWLTTRVPLSRIDSIAAVRGVTGMQVAWRARTFDETSMPDIHATDQLVRSEEHLRVLEAVRRLPTRQRDCITLRYFEELSIDRIAETLGVSASSVKTHLQRAMSALDRTLSEQ